MTAFILALTILLPIHGALWYGIRSERKKMRIMFRLAMRGRR